MKISTIVAMLFSATAGADNAQSDEAKLLALMTEAMEHYSRSGVELRQWPRQTSLRFNRLVKNLTV